MKRALVIISGVYLLIFGLWMFFMCVAMFSFSSISSGQLPEEQAKMIPFIGILFYGPLGIGLIATAVGLFLNKNWARIVTIILSSVALILGILGLISIGLIHSMGETADPAMDASNIRMIGIIIYGIFLVLIPAFFLILFNSRAVNILFLGIEDNSEDVQRLIEEKKKNPIGIKLVATYYCIMLLGGGFVFFQPNNQEIPVIGDFLWLSGTPLKIYQLSMAFIFFSVGIGFFYLKKWAWRMAVIFQSLAVLLGAFYVITLTQEVLDRMYSHLQDIVTPFQMTVGTAQTLGFFGLIFALVILIYVLRKKGVFIN